MKKVLKQTLSVFLAVVMTFTITLPAFAEENVETETEQDVSYNGTNAIGDVVINAMNESEETTENETGINYFIKDVEINGLIATVELYAPDETTLLVAVYDESSGVMTTSGKIDVDSNTETVAVELAECEMPDYFVVKAFLLDSENAPVCTNYESIKYTKDFQEFLAKTVFDFDEEKVINLDYGYESNFAVVSEDAKVITESEEENTVIVDDYENGIYVFGNANEEITSLNVGDVLYYVYGDEADEYILTKVGTIKNDNGTVTITAADDFEISELFSYIKIDTEQAVYEKPQTFAMDRSFDDEAGDEEGFSNEFSISLTKEYEIAENFKVSFSGELKAKFYLQFYYNFNLLKEDYYEITQSLTISATGETTISAAAKKEFEPLVLFHGGIPIYAGIEAEVTFSLKFVFSAEISATGTLEASLVNGSRKVAGCPDENISKEPSVEIKLNISGKVAFDVIPSVSVGFKILKVIKVEMGVEANFKIEGVINKLDLNSGESILIPDDKHFCDICVDGTITLSCSGFISVSFGLNKEKQKTVLKINLFSASITLGDFYISVDKENEIVKNIDFGFGKCPYIEYKVTFKAIDELFNPLQNVLISISDMNFLTDADGQTVCYLNDGTYSCLTSLDDYEINNDLFTFDKVSFAVHGSPTTVYIYMKKTNSNGGDSGGNNTGTDGIKTVIDSGSCGDNLTWTYYDNGELMIDGSGEMEDYGYIAVPWDAYKSTITDVTINDSVTTIGAHAFYGCKSLTNVTIGNSVTTIGNSAFAYCGNLANVTIGDSVTIIGADAFRSCESLTNIIIPDSVTTIGMLAFAYCGNLASVTIGDSVTTIGNFAFNACKGLTSITIPYSVTTIGMLAFAYCDSLASIEVDENNVIYSSDEYGVLFSKDKNELIQYPTGNSRTEYIIPDSVTIIDEVAFAYCYSLESITIPDSVTIIGVDAFFHCDNLVSILIPDSVTTIGEGAFRFCSFECITIPDSVTTIGNSAFAYCGNLASVTIGDSVTTIGNFAFYSCDSLSTVYYTGTEEQWNNISFGPNNKNLINANIIFNYSPSAVALMSLLPDNKLSAYSESNMQVKTISDAVIGNDYVMVAVKDENAEDLLAPSNLLYIDQKTAESEELTFEYVIDESITDYDVLVFGQKLAHYHLYNGVVTSPTCTEQGYITYTCSCGDSYVADYVDATGHTDEVIPGYGATCTETGLTDGVKCSVCGEVTSEQEIIPVIEHDDSDSDGYCDECGEDLTVNCSHFCHSDGFIGFFWKIINFLQKLFGVQSSRYCECGVDHWSK